MAEEELRAKADALLLETPKVDAAVKNLLAVQIGRVQVLQVRGKIHTIGSSGLEVLEELEDCDPMVLQKLCGLILREINAHELEDPLEWASRNPQGQDQPGLDRIDQISSYKALHFVWTKSKKHQDNQSNNNQDARRAAKVTKLFGRSMLETIWPDVRPKILEKGTSLASQAIVEKLLDNLLPQDDIASNSKPSASAELRGVRKDETDDSDLVWASDFNQAILLRSKKRKEEVDKKAQAAASQVD